MSNFGKALRGLADMAEGLHDCEICGKPGVKKDFDYCAECYMRIKDRIDKNRR